MPFSTERESVIYSSLELYLRSNHQGSSHIKCKSCNHFFRLNHTLTHRHGDIFLPDLAPTDETRPVMRRRLKDGGDGESTRHNAKGCNWITFASCMLRNTCVIGEVSAF